MNEYYLFEDMVNEYINVHGIWIDDLIEQKTLKLI